MTDVSSLSVEALIEEIEQHLYCSECHSSDCQRPSPVDRLLGLAARALQASQWQPIETAPKDGTPFLVTWAPSRMGGRTPVVEMVGGWDEYEEVRSYGEPEAYGWHPLPRALSSPFTLPAPPALHGGEP